jgi:hypothetical protein
MNEKLDLTPPVFVPWDIEVARVNFGANCGPSAFAATTQREVCRVMQYFPHFPDQRWTNLRQMLRAFASARYSTHVEKCAAPSHGVALVQWLGPWTEKEFFNSWSLLYTHWIGVDGNWIFDHNACCWQTISEWAAGTAAVLMSEIPRAKGWRIKYGVEVSKEVASAQGSLSPCRMSCLSRR